LPLSHAHNTTSLHVIMPADPAFSKRTVAHFMRCFELGLSCSFMSHLHASTSIIQRWITGAVRCKVVSGTLAPLIHMPAAARHRSARLPRHLLGTPLDCTSPQITPGKFASLYWDRSTLQYRFRSVALSRHAQHKTSTFSLTQARRAMHMLDAKSVTRRFSRNHAGARRRADARGITHAPLQRLVVRAATAEAPAASATRRRPDQAQQLQELLREVVDVALATGPRGVLRSLQAGRAVAGLVAEYVAAGRVDPPQVGAVVLRGIKVAPRLLWL
jgi:hypothetical protein